MRLPSITLAIAAAVVVACSGGGEPSSSPSPSPEPPGTPGPTGGPGAPPAMSDLDGRTFIVIGAEGREIVAGTTISFRFEDGRVGIQAGCNQLSGAYELTDGVLAVGQMITTEMGCEPALMDQDAWLGSFVNGATLALDGPMLTLANGGAILTATDKEVVMPDLPLEGTTWTVDGLVSADAVSSMPAGVTATLVFGDGRVSVNAGCNRGMGSAAIGDATIAFGPIATTKMACEPAAMQVERHVLDALQGEVGYEIDGRSLTLGDGGSGLTAAGAPGS